MKYRKILISSLIIALLSGTAVYAADTVVQKLRVWVNKKEVDDGGLLVDGKSYISVKSLNEKLDGIFIWDDSTKRVNIYKPNVHMFTTKGNVDFGEVNKNGKVKFSVFSQIDSLKVEISAFKITIEDPYGDSTWIDGRDSGDKDFIDTSKENFWFSSREITYTFESTGKYVVRFWMRPAGESSYQVVSEKVIYSK
jgi:hypothetical protein